MRISILFSIVAALFLMMSCKKDSKAEITVINCLSNVALQRVSFGDMALSYGWLMPGEKTQTREISERDDDIDLPLRRRVKFYMTNGDNVVYLETKEFFELQKDDKLTIEIKDDTEVINLVSGYTRSFAEYIEQGE